MAVSTKSSMEGVDDLLRKLRASTLKNQKKVDLIVGYKAPYAIYVHENLESYHPNGQAKYLETPFRQLYDVLTAMIHKDLVNKKGLAYAVLRAGRLLLKESRKLVPVRTGFLRDSGFIELDNKPEATEG